MEAWPLPSDCVRFVDCVDSDEFSFFLQALDRASVVAMDAEWKPLRSSNMRTFSRVSIMQLACRLATPSVEPSEGSTFICQDEVTDTKVFHYDTLRSANHGVDSIAIANEDVELLGNSNFDSQGSTLSTSRNKRAVVAVDQSTPSNSEEGQKYLELSLCRLRENQDVIFILDMMSLPIHSFWEAMKRMLVSSTVLKLGFRFKHDLVNLAKSFPGPDAHSCFDKVEPYVDVGKMFLDICGWDSTHENTPSLATICEQVVGYSLCKDLQCSNWEQRPLTIEQQVYAAADAHCLLVAYDILKCKVLKAANLGCDHFVDLKETSTEDGIGTILHDLLDLQLTSSTGKVLHASHGVATFMVESAVATRMLVTDDLPVNASSAAHTLLLKKFGERLLLSEVMSKRSSKKKPKRAQENRVMTSTAERGFYGPPPWDPCCGGDGTPRFLCDDMVEGLAKQLRNVGFDAVFLRARKSDPRKMVELAEKEGRVLLTKDVKLVCLGFVPPNYAYHVKSVGKREQLAEVVKRFNLEIVEDNLLSRCNKCNSEFFPDALTPEEALATCPELQTFLHYAIKERVLFWQCSQCKHMYWQGKQFYRALQTLQDFARKVQMSQ